MRSLHCGAFYKACKIIIAYDSDSASDSGNGRAVLRASLSNASAGETGMHNGPGIISFALRRTMWPTIKYLPILSSIVYDQLRVNTRLTTGESGRANHKSAPSS